MNTATLNHVATQNTQPLTLPFSAITAADLPLVGGKGANLGEMTQAGLPVPGGFCITVTAFRHFMQASNLAEEIYLSLESIGAGDVERTRVVGEQVRGQLAQVPLPVEVARAIVAAWQTLGAEDRYAVRSSATAEDLPDASFAGQQDSFLNVSGQQQLLESVRACWISLFTDRAILYRAQNNFSHREVLLAVVVQRMVLPEVSGILFTADPISGHRHIISIDASYGLGEALVAGLVSPDLYKVDKRSHTLIETHISDKQMAIRPRPEGGTYREALEGEMRHSRVLTDEQVLMLAALGARIEAHYGRPQDIEWCWAQGQFYIVQARPITSLFPLPQPAPPDKGLRIYFSLSHAQVMTDPMPPMGIAYWRLLFPFGKGNDPMQENPYLTSAAGRIYVDLTPMLRVPKLGRGLPNVLKVADILSAQAIRTVAARPEFVNDSTHGHARPAVLAKWLLPLWGGIVARLFWLSPDGATERLSAFIETYIESARAKLAAKPAGAPRLRVAQELLVTIFPKHIIAVPPYLASGMLAKMLLTRLMRSVGDATQVATDIEAIGRGLTGNVTTEMDLQVGDLADAARPSPALVQHLSQSEAKDALATAHTIPGSEPFLAAWQEFMRRYGMRGPSEIDVSRPGWNEEPASLLQVVIANLQHSESGAHRAKHRQNSIEGEAAALRLEQAAARGLAGMVRRPLVRRLIRVARALIPIREHPKYMMIRLRGLVRATILECAAILVQRGQLQESGDVWFLTWHELVATLEEPRQEVMTRICTRRQQHLRHWQIVPPRVITSDGEIPVVAHSRADVPEGALAGSPVSAGIVEGIAKVILDPQRELLSPGEILIAPFTDPGWTPLFINAAGLVMEVGGLMTHGSVVAREYGIPAVVSVLDATKKIQSGQRIRVNGSLGYVEILGDSNE